MKLGGLLSAALVLAALLGALYWSNHHKASEDTSLKPPPDAAPKILSLDKAGVARLAISRRSILLGTIQGRGKLPRPSRWPPTKMRFPAFFPFFLRSTRTV